MATTMTLTEDQEKVLIAAHRHPDDQPSPRTIAETIDDDYLKVGYVERIMNDFSLPPETLAELEESTEDPGGDGDTEAEAEADDGNGAGKSDRPETVGSIVLNAEPIEDSEPAGGMTPESEPVDATDDPSDDIEDTDDTAADDTAADDTDSDTDDADTALEEIIPMLTSKQYRALTYLVAAPHSVSHKEIADAADAGQPYIYNVTAFNDNDMVRKVSVDLGDRSSPRKQWAPTVRAAEAFERYVHTHPEEMRDIFAVVPDVDENGKWTGETRDGEIVDIPVGVREDLAIDTALTPLAAGDGAHGTKREEDEDKRVSEGVSSDEDAAGPDQEAKKFADENLSEVFSGNSEAKKEIEQLSKESDKSAFRCTRCGDTFDTHAYARMHITNSPKGPHKGRNGNEPGIIDFNHEFLKEISPRSDGHDGSVSVDLDLDSLFDPKDADSADTSATDGVETTSSTVQKGNVTTVGAFDATGGKSAGDGAKRLREPTTIQNRRVKSTQSEADSGADTDMTTDEATSGGAFAIAELSREEAFELLGSDAPESVRKRVFDAIADGS